MRYQAKIMKVGYSLKVKSLRKSSATYLVVLLSHTEGMKQKWRSISITITKAKS